MKNYHSIKLAAKQKPYTYLTLRKNLDDFLSSMI